MQTYLEQAFGKSDCSSVKMRGAVREWMDLYYGASRSGEDGSARLAVLVVSNYAERFLPSMTCIGTSTTIGRRNVIRTP